VCISSRFYAVDRSIEFSRLCRCNRETEQSRESRHHVCGDCDMFKGGENDRVFGLRSEELKRNKS
jgi:hypothetical protein